MPFTFAHPAIVLPLNRLKWFSLTGLVVGAMVPDFEYFIRMHILSIYSHTILGLFWFDVPLGILIAFLFHNCIRDRFYDNLPAALNARLSPYKSFKWNQYFKKHWLIVLASIFIGACSHLLLDDFTHPQGYFVKLAPGIFTYPIGSIPLFKILQHLFTLIGTAYITYYIWRMPTTPVRDKQQLKYWGYIILLSTIILILRFWIMPDYHHVANVVVSAITAFMLSLFFVPMLIDMQPNHD